MGGTAPNEGPEEEGSPEPTITWHWLLDEGEDGVFSLKSLPAVKKQGGTKNEIAYAIREYVRQAWGKYNIMASLSGSDFYIIVQSGRTWRIQWAKIEAGNSSFFDPKFLLEDIKLKNPTRMNGDKIESYWKHWFEMAAKGDPLSLISVKKSSTTKPSPPSPGESDEEIPLTSKNKEKGRGQPASDPFVLEADFGIPLPCDCDTSKERTIYLQDLVPNRGAFEFYHTLVQQVDGFIVSFFHTYLLSYLMPF